MTGKDFENLELSILNLKARDLSNETHQKRSLFYLMQDELDRIIFIRH